MTDAVTTLEVALGDRSYPIHIGAGLIERADELLAPCFPLRRTMVVTDQNLAGTPHPLQLASALERAGVEVRTLVLPAGEATKSWRFVEQVVDELLDFGAERRSTVVALGRRGDRRPRGFRGRGDAARNRLRPGADHAAGAGRQCGGRQDGINTRRGKNLVGAFYQPRAVLIDTSVLDGLPSRELRAGYAEVAKYGVIRDADGFFGWLEEHGGAVLRGDPAARADAIRRSLEIKAAIVAADERETSGERALLNFGHTFAHAYEALAGYDGSLLHGEAVAVGMVKAMALSRELGRCAERDVDRLRAHLAGQGLPTRLAEVSNRDFPPEELLLAMGRDKKVEASRIRFVLARRIGEAFTSAEVPAETLRAILAQRCLTT